MHSLVPTLLATAALAGFAVAAPKEGQLTAMVWRSPPITCQGCPEAVGRLLSASSQKFNVIYVGPNEKVKVTPKTLSEVDLFAYGGGPGTFCLTRLSFCCACPIIFPLDLNCSPFFKIMKKRHMRISYPTKNTLGACVRDTKNHHIHNAEESKTSANLAHKKARFASFPLTQYLHRKILPCASLTTRAPQQT